MPVNFNLDTIRTLDANKTYYLSNTTGEIKEAGFWQKFKCLFGVKSAQRKVANLIDAIRSSLIQESGLKTNDVLDENIRANINLKKSVKGSVLKDLVTRFSVADEETRIQNRANMAIKNTARSAADALLRTDPEMGDKDALNMIFAHAMKASLRKDLPKSQDTTGGPLRLNTTGFVSTLKPIEDEVVELLKDVLNSKALGPRGIDKAYAKHIIDTLFNEDGTRREGGVERLKSALEIRTNDAFGVGLVLNNNRPQIVYNLLKEKFNINPKDKIKELIDLCEGDKELEEVVLNAAPSLCVNSNNNLRSAEQVKAKIAALKDNLEEFRALGFDKGNGIPKIFIIALANLEGVAFPKGMITKVLEQVNKAPLAPFQKIKGFSEAHEIYAAVDETRKTVDRVFKNINVVKEFMDAGEEEVGGPHSVATRILAMGMLWSRLEPSTINAMSKAFTGTEASKMLGIVSKLTDDMRLPDNTVYTDPKEREFLKNILESNSKMHEVSLETLGYVTGDDLQCDENPDADVNEGPAIEIREHMDLQWENEQMKNHRA